MPDFVEPNSRQVGGRHYKTVDYEPWDFVADCGLDYFAGTAVKYLVRRKGDRAEDLEKAVHFLEKRAAVAAARPGRWGRPPERDGEPASGRLGRLCRAHGASGAVRKALERLLAGQWLAAAAAAREEIAALPGSQAAPGRGPRP